MKDKAEKLAKEMVSKRDGKAPSELVVKIVSSLLAIPIIARGGTLFRKSDWGSAPGE